MRNNVDKIAGIFLTLLVTLFFIWAGSQWLDRDWKPGVFDKSEENLREKNAVKRLKGISLAQQQFIEKDWDGNGSKEFARFLVQLWQCVDESSSEPVKVDLIAKELALAMQLEFALEGYRFRLLRYRALEKPSDDESIKHGAVLDFSKEWAASAYPVPIDIKGQKDKENGGRYAYILTSEGKLYQRGFVSGDVYYLPHDLNQGGWENITGE